MGWINADPNSCCGDSHNAIDTALLEGNIVYVYTTCQTCEADSRDAFLDRYTEDYNFNPVPADWTADPDHCSPDTGGQDDVVEHDWGNWMFTHKGGRVKAKRVCQRCQTRHAKTYVYRYTEYDDATLPEFTEDDHVAYHPDTTVDLRNCGAAAEIVSVNHDTGEYTLEIVDPTYDELIQEYNLTAGTTVTTAPVNLDLLDA